jgi:hypothetical protein
VCAPVSCPGRAQRGEAERNESRDPAQESRSAIRRVAPRSRVSLRSPGTREIAGAQSEPLAIVLSHDVKQRSVLRSRDALLRPGLACFSSHPLRRDFAGHSPSPNFGAQASRPLSASATTDSRTPDEGWMERRQAHSLTRSRLRSATTRSRGDRDLSRRSTVAIFGCGPTKPAPGSGTGAAATARAKH